MSNALRALFVVQAVVFWADAGKKIAVPRDFPSIQAALGDCDAGDTIVVGKGIYRENIALPDNIVLQGEAMLTTIIDGSRKGPCVTGADGAVIRNFTIRNGTVGVLCRNTRTTIDRNLIIDNKGAGIHAVLTLPEISNNIICRNKWSGIFLEEMRSTQASVNHNVIAENGYSGVFCGARTEAFVHNNIITKNKEFGIYIGRGAGKTRITNNNLFENRAAYNRSAVVPPSNIQEPPDFVKPGPPGFDYFVKPVSACKAQGENGTDIGLVTDQAAVVQVNDRDADGIPDEVDQCPGVPEDKDGFEDEDGCPDPDNDQDGIADAHDQCPNLAGNLGGKEGCPEYDRDRDGVPDSVDRCPDQAAVYGSAPNGGCPEPEATVQSFKAPFVLEGVHFRSASAELLDESHAALDRVVSSLKADADIKVEIAGHTDEEGGDSYNLALSNDRAKAVRNYLIAQGVSADRIAAKGYGKTRPLVADKNDAGRAKNRRVEVLPVK